MLRNRSRTVAKQPLMADQSSLPSPGRNHSRPISSFFGSPRFFNGFLGKSKRSEAEGTVIISPTSILDAAIHLSNFGNPFGYDKSMPETPKDTFPQEAKHLDDQKSADTNSEGIGIALIQDKAIDNICESHNTRKVLFGSKLKIQIPPLPPSSNISSTGSPKSPGDFGIKTRNSQLSAFGSPNPKSSPSPGPLSLKEMELSEEYTCVISHGPNPKTTHIYDNCVVERCCGVLGMSELKNEQNLESLSHNFLSCCYTCKKNLGEDRDIFMYRGEKAFCSEECRSQEMLLDGLKNS